MALATISLGLGIQLTKIVFYLRFLVHQFADVRHGLNGTDDHPLFILIIA